MNERLCSILTQCLVEVNSENVDRKLMYNHLRRMRKVRKERVFKYCFSSNKRKKIRKVKNFLKEIEKFDDMVFKSHFRMTKHAFQILLKKIKPFYKEKKRGRTKLKLKIAVYMTVWRLSTGCSFRELSNLFDVGKGTTYTSCLEIQRILYRLRKNFIKWPWTADEQRKCAQGFQDLRKCPFPFVIGCVDGCHIRITAPPDDPISYYNRKKFHSIILQGVCDYTLKFIDVFVGFPGSCHDANVWQQSPLGKELKSGERKFIDNYFLLGDSAYPLNKYLIVPYRDNGFLTDVESKFNYVHSSTRVSIEQTFGRLKSMFRILKFLDVKNMKYVKFTIISCVVLHNFIIEIDHLNDEFSDAELTLDEKDFVSYEAEVGNTGDGETGKILRDRLAMLFTA